VGLGLVHLVNLLCGWLNIWAVPPREEQKVAKETGCTSNARRPPTRTDRASPERAPREAQPHRHVGVHVGHIQTVPKPHRPVAQRAAVRAVVVRRKCGAAHAVRVEQDHAPDARRAKRHAQAQRGELGERAAAAVAGQPDTRAGARCGVHLVGGWYRVWGLGFEG